MLSFDPAQAGNYDWNIMCGTLYDGLYRYSLELACGVNVVGGTSYTHYCDPVADDMVNQAEALPLGAQRDALMRRVQLRFLHSATRVPLAYFKNYNMVSPRVGGFYYEPIFGWQFENYWLKG